jgi:ferredoxin-type protein NapG
LSSEKPPGDESLARARRLFFRKVLLSGIEQVEKAGEKFVGRVRPPEPSPATLPAHAKFPEYKPLRPKYVRPPGALPEAAFIETCSQCGDCVRACPADAIKMDANVAGGFPHIVPRESPCVICDDLSCMKVCPTDALVLVDAVSEIRMGLAMVDDQTCLRGPDGSGEDCQLCVQQCPVGESAIRIGTDSLVEVRDACTGCGVCERACPTEPASIYVETNV